MNNWEKIRNNKDWKEREMKRSRIFDLIREFFKKQQFLEIHCPTLLACPGMEPYLDQISVDFKNEKGKTFKGYLSTSPEYSMKKMLSAGFKKIFNMSPAFRGSESFGGTHNIEFTILEWYRANQPYTKIMEDCEDLVLYLLEGKASLVYQGQKINLKKPWDRMTIREACLKYADFDLDENKTVSAIKKTAAKKGYPVAHDATWDDVFYLIFLNEVEVNLPKDKPVFLYEYPLPQAALARRVAPDSFYAERFELYIGGLEIGNCFGELVDWKEQKKRLLDEQKLRKSLGKDPLKIDNDFIKALKLGCPESSGIAVGVDRLQMLLLNVKDINELMPFPNSQMDW